MTCRHADTLIEDVLNGEVDADSEDGLREHLSHCERCAEAWHTAWQVRGTLNRCDGYDPGEQYFEQATVGIMDRIAAIEAEATATERSPAVSSVRHGPLPVRGVGLAFLLLLGFFADALTAPVDYIRGNAPDRPDRVRLPEAADVVALPQSLPSIDPHSHAAAVQNRPLPANRRCAAEARSLRSIDPIEEHLIPFTSPPLLLQLT